MIRDIPEKISRIVAWKRPDIQAMKRRKDFKGLIHALKHKDLEIAASAAHALGEIGEYDIQRLIGTFGHQKVNSRLGIIEALAQIKDPLTVNIIQSALDDSHQEVRWEAALALSEFNDPSVIQSLIKTMRDSDPFVRYSAARALDKLGWQPENDLDYGFYALAKQNWDLFKNLGNPAIPSLALASESKNPHFRAKAAELLGAIHDKRAVSILYRSMQDEQEKVRWNAVKSALNLGISIDYIPRGIFQRPHLRKIPLIAGILNFFLPGTGYSYLGMWWGVIIFQIDITFTLWLFVYWGKTLTFGVIFPIYTLLAIHAWYMAHKMDRL
jgi:HEAT repeat protein